MTYINLDINLNEVSKKPTRDGYGEGLLIAGEQNPDIVALGSDVTSSVRVDWFKDKYPDRFFSIGIAEQNQMCIAAGLSLAGKIPFVTNYGVFLSGRAWDQLRTSVCYSNLNVKMGGSHGGVTVGPDGATHQALEDISITRCLPNMTIIVPADYHEARKATIAVSKAKGPMYIRLGRDGVPILTKEDTPFEIGKAYCIRKGTDVALIACGIMVYESLKAAEELAAEGISAMVINNHAIKPLDKETILEAAKITGAVVTSEEHQVAGGMGSAVVEFLSQNYPVPIKMVGINDRFGESGTADVLLKEFGLTSRHVAEAARQVIKMKNK